MTQTSIKVQHDDLGPPVACESQDLGAGPVDIQRTILHPAQDPLGCLTFHRVAVGSGDAVIISDKPGQLYGYRVYNNSPDVTAGRVGYRLCIKLHNQAVLPTPGAAVFQCIAV